MTVVFEDFEIWQMSREFCQSIYAISGAIKESKLREQIMATAGSIMDDIAQNYKTNNLEKALKFCQKVKSQLYRIKDYGYISESEFNKLYNAIDELSIFISTFYIGNYYPISDYTETITSREDMGRMDEKFEEIARWVVESQEGSTSAIQRRFEIGYNRAGRITDQLEKALIVGKSNGSCPREVLIYDLGVLERLLLELL